MSLNLFNKHKYKHMSMLSLCVYYDLYDWKQEVGDKIDPLVN